MHAMCCHGPDKRDEAGLRDHNDDHPFLSTALVVALEAIEHEEDVLALNSIVLRWQLRPNEDEHHFV
ncbi:unnamed protein product [Phytophthora lilii]|uniref:Unnamed protein product n=1 Tax=Phytophthora lilii TaxID=2077276 RepID=A0A9W6WTF0_9STRA|nr:unnamed protein product [Phytophthora lilii]